MEFRVAKNFRMYYFNRLNLRSEDISHPTREKRLSTVVRVASLERKKQAEQYFCTKNLRFFKRKNSRRADFWTFANKFARGDPAGEAEISFVRQKLSFEFLKESPENLEFSIFTQQCIVARFIFFVW